MLFPVNENVKITQIPHEKDFNRWTSRLSHREIYAIEKELNGQINHNQVVTSIWITGADWTGTSFQPIWEKACLRNMEAAAKCFGLLFWKVMMERPDAWSFGRYSLKNVPLSGMTYFLRAMPA